MSTKIYDAYRVPVRRLNEFLDLSSRIIIRRALKRMRELMGKVDTAAVQAKYNEYDKKWKDGGSETPPWLWKSLCLGAAIELCREASAKAERDLDWCLDCGWNVWIKGNYAYLIPWGEYWLRQRLRMPAWAKDYSYWNNTDEPDDVTYREWQRRGEVWTSLWTPWPGFKLSHEVISFAAGSRDSEHLFFHKIVPERDRSRPARLKRLAAKKA